MKEVKLETTFNDNLRNTKPFRDNNIVWYQFFTLWTLILFILYKLNILPYSPYYVYAFIIVFIFSIFIYKLAIALINKFQKNEPLIPENNEKTNYTYFIILLVFIFFADLLPIFFCKRELSKEGLLFFLTIFLVYMIYMESKKIGVLDHYFNMNLKIFFRHYSRKQIRKNLKYFLGIN